MGATTEFTGLWKYYWNFPPIFVSKIFPVQVSIPTIAISMIFFHKNGKFKPLFHN